jgi:hypothetical protein
MIGDKRGDDRGLRRTGGQQTRPAHLHNLGPLHPICQESLPTWTILTQWARLDWGILVIEPRPGRWWSFREVNPDLPSHMITICRWAIVMSGRPRTTMAGKLAPVLDNHSSSSWPDACHCTRIWRGWALVLHSWSCRVTRAAGDIRQASPTMLKSGPGFLSSLTGMRKTQQCVLPSQEWWACVVWIPFAGVAGLCHMNPLRRSGGPVSYTSPSWPWAPCRATCALGRS